MLEDKLALLWVFADFVIRKMDLRKDERHQQ
jgi:hypothetical protein